MDKPGTGKSCSVGGFSEKIKDHLKINELYDHIEMFFSEYNTNIKKCIILVKSKLLLREFKYQLVNRCSAPGSYVIDPTTLDKLRQRKITTLLSVFYELETYTKFAKKISSLTNEQLINIYADTLFIVDESHNLHIRESELGDVRAKNDIGETDDDTDKNKIRQKEETYRQIDRLFHNVPRIKIVLMTATVMINDPKEIIDLINLILPLDNQMKFDRPISDISIEEIEPYFRGRISFVRESSVFIVPQYIGDYIYKDIEHRHRLTYDIGGKEYTSQQKIYVLPMITDVVDETGTILDIITQGKIYDGTSKEKIVTNIEQPSSFHLKEKQICNGIYPDGSYGKEGFQKYFEYNINKDEYIPNEELYDFISNSERLQLLSIKSQECIDIVKSVAIPELNIDGPIYIYCHFKKGSGAFYLGACMTAQGIERFKGKESAFNSIYAQGLSPYTEEVMGAVCTPTIEDNECKRAAIEKVINSRIINISKKIRYAILTSDLKDYEISNILELYNSPENKFGEYLKALILTPIAREGINLSNSLKFILYDPGWNKSNEEQAKSRGLRQTSHDEILLILRQITGNPNYILNIPIYNMCAINPNSGTSIELQLYQLSEKKDIKIKKIERYMKKIAVDQMINVKRNIKPIEIDNSPECDYDICNYTSYNNPSENYIDYSSYDILYSDNEIKEIISKIISLFSFKYKYSLTELFDKLNVYRRHLIIRALNKIMIDRIDIYNRLGFKSKLLENGGILFIQVDEDLFDGLTQDSVYYNENLTIMEESSIEEYLANLESKQLENLLYLLDTSQDINNFEKLFNSLNVVANKITIFEKAVIMYYINNITDMSLINYLINKYSKTDFYKLGEPVKEIWLYIQKSIKPKRGRPKKKPLEKTPISPYMTPEPKLDEGEDVYIHTLLPNTIRLLKISEKMWRTANEYEIPIYKRIVDEMKNKEMEFLNKQPVYGLYNKKTGFVKGKERRRTHRPRSDQRDAMG